MHWPQLLVEFDLTAADLGLVLAGLYALAVVGSPLAGPLVDRIGGRRACLMLLVASGAALAVASLAASRTGLILAMLPAGAAMSFANPGTSRWASAAATEGQQATLVGIAQAGVQAGAMAAGGLAAAAAVGLTWRGSFRIGALLAAVGVIAAWRAPDDRVVDPSGTDRLNVGQVDTDAKGAPRGQQRKLAVYALMMGAGTGIVLAYLPSYSVDAAGMSVAAAGATTMVFGATALLSRLGLGLALEDVDQAVVPLLLVMAVGSAISLAAVSAGTLSQPWLWVGVVLFGATGTTWPTVAFLAAVRLSRPGQAGRVAGWVAGAFYLGLWLAPPVAGWAITAFGYGPVWIGAAACYLLASGPATATGD